jgi:hypothetical protein
MAAAYASDPATVFATLKFLFKIDLIKPDYDAQFEIRTGGESFWIPPTLPEGVTTTATTGWMRWTSTGMEQVANPGLAPDFRVSSLFYCSENGFFYGVPFDCRRQSVQSDRLITGRGWRRLMFKYTDDDPPISVIGFDTEYHVLAARGSISWMPQLIPASYNHNQAQLHGVIADRTGLGGDLSILLGMAALSCAPIRDPREILRVIGSCFRPSQWRRHNLPTGSE